MHLNVRKESRKIHLRDRSRFLERLSVLLTEGYLLPTALKLLLPIHCRTLEAAEAGLDSILKSGGNAAELLKFLGFKDSVLFPVEIAEHHGRLSESLQSIAKSYGRTEQVRTKLRNILVYPVSLLGFTSLLFLFFRLNYVPNLTELMASLQSGEGNSGVPGYLLKLPDFFITGIAVSLISAFVFWKILKARKVRVQINWLLRIPVVKQYIRLYWSHLIARELGTLVHSGISLQESVKVLTEQNHHGIVRFIAGNIKSEIIQGQPLSTAVERMAILSTDMPAFLKHGELTGFLGKELILYSDVQMEQIEQHTQKWLRIIQPTFFIIIAACIVAAYLAILLPMYNLVHTI
ncbi:MULTISPECIES: competence type IV pilus assembly protein ComGB [Planomicrobium]|uniref:competence type IV pilus assembly protein ComGB n=1 Tax=Planomicrobium TaxID=162291 RepID=UPI000C7A75E2|nr:competence type IV pilus assembly protein ComGB [Planomicrobium sp. MB-3u-38]PKH08480.1 competence protein ComG [Planomicrobium sp. MB-3u-38]